MFPVERLIDIHCGQMSLVAFKGHIAALRHDVNAIIGERECRISSRQL